LMDEERAKTTHRWLLEPVDRISEILFGLIMAVTIVGSLSIANAGHNEVRTVLAAALGCNLAWGLVDAVMYLVRTLTERAHNRRLVRRVIDAEGDEVAHRLIEQSLPSEVMKITGREELEGMRQRMLRLQIPSGPLLHRVDYVAAFRIFLLVVFATFPVVLPFLLTDNAALAMEASRVLTLVMLFLAGFSLGRHTWHPHPMQPGIWMTLLGVALIAAVKALGG
jgi:VIT1/CCC1 family predicted Fe2+/Mn2+ transporter